MDAILAGDFVELTFRERAGDRVVLAQVDTVETREEGLYFSYRPEDDRHGLHGCAMQRTTPKPFGLQGVKILSALRPGTKVIYQGNRTLGTVKRALPRGLVVVAWETGLGYTNSGQALAQYLEVQS